MLSLRPVLLDMQLALSDAERDALARFLDFFGPDSVANLQWQTIRDARAKDAWKQKSCTR